MPKLFAATVMMEVPEEGKFKPILSVLLVEDIETAKQTAARDALKQFPNLTISYTIAMQIPDHAVRTAANFL